ncbi:MAG: hypothetical protein M3Y55_08350 [Pseudomonadota bacterium]|nr:hypothetical protein [Pseudomonadota bacterium]
MKRTLVLALAAAATLFGATAAQAARVDGSVGINVPPVGAVFAPAYTGYPAYAAPVGYAPRSRYVEPAPVYLPRPIFYAPRPRIWLPPLPFFGQGRWHDDGHGHGDHDGRVGWRR